jgi:rod shape-determining protein MreD
MIRTEQLIPDISSGSIIKVFLYTFFVLLLQAHVIPRVPFPALRADLLLPVMFGAAVLWSPVAGVIWACFWGFVVDNFSGEFWGLHVGSYMVMVCMVYMASDKFDCRNPVYQMGLVGVCALGQSVALGLYLCFVPMDIPSLTSIWIGLGIRTLLSVTLAPLIIYPVLHQRSPY